MNDTSDEKHVNMETTVESWMVTIYSSKEFNSLSLWVKQCDPHERKIIYSKEFTIIVGYKKCESRERKIIFNLVHVKVRPFNCELCIQIEH